MLEWIALALRICVCIARLPSVRRAWKEVVHNDGGRLAIFEAADFVDPPLVVLGLILCQESLDKPGLLCHCSKGSQKPAVTQAALVDVRWLHIIGEDLYWTTAKLTGALPHHHRVVCLRWVLEEGRISRHKLHVYEPQAHKRVFGGGCPACSRASC